ncbi:hypothetical protein EVAR_93729_1 [Eumeta japonica]|uniref:Uncharacterized protein n=1 Tax=Eumeta variegata TaxID=151549 RepID=A0A4C1U2N1_EUMVA|nr:hypothetical protein EVAR_93729_1 [Eumeta japonica]
MFDLSLNTTTRPHELTTMSPVRLKPSSSPRTPPAPQTRPQRSTVVVSRLRVSVPANPTRIAAVASPLLNPIMPLGLQDIIVVGEPVERPQSPRRAAPPPPPPLPPPSVCISLKIACLPALQRRL